MVEMTRSDVGRPGCAGSWQWWLPSLEHREAAEVVGRRRGGCDGGIVGMTVVGITDGDDGW